MKLDYLLNKINKQDKPLILDGALGSLIQQKDNSSDKNLWVSYINFKKPEIVELIHEDYIKAGADIITSNTFRTNPAALQSSNFDLDVNKAVELSMRISRKIADKYNVILAGSNPPAEDCYQKERYVKFNNLKQNHHKHISLLYENGADIILNETQSHMDEIKIICEYCNFNKIPFMMSLFVQENLTILSGENINNVLDFIKLHKPIAILFNCITEQTLYKLSKEIELNFVWGFYINCGDGNYTDNNISCGIDEIKYKDIVKSYLCLDPSIIGACCGSNPKHIKAIRDLLNE